MTDPTNTLPEPYQSGMLKPCPFCGRNMSYEEEKGILEWHVLIKHEYDTKSLYIPCPMTFYKDIKWRDWRSGEVFNEDIVNRKKQEFIDTWNRRGEE